jgi:hypothetical protein
MENPTATTTTTTTTPSGENVPILNPPIAEQIQSATVPSSGPATAAVHHGYLLVVSVAVAEASQMDIHSLSFSIAFYLFSRQAAAQQDALLYLDQVRFLCY